VQWWRCWLAVSCFKKKSHSDACQSIKCVFCGEQRRLDDGNVRAAAAHITHKVNSHEDKKYVQKITREWRQLAEDIGHDGLLSSIGTISNPVLDLRAAGVFYDRTCYALAKRKQSRKSNVANNDTVSNQSNEEFMKLFTLKQVISYIECSKRENKTSFKLADLGSMYKRILDNYDIIYEFQSKRFFELLKAKLPALQKFHHGRGAAAYVTLNSTTSKEMFEPSGSREEFEQINEQINEFGIWNKKSVPAFITEDINFSNQTSN